MSFGAISTFGPYRAAFITGLTGAGGSRTADVINSSYVFDLARHAPAPITDRNARRLDQRKLADAAHVGGRQHAASGAGPNRVLSAASGYNNMAVAALAPNGGPFNVASVFSNGGPNDYNDPSTALSPPSVR